MAPLLSKLMLGDQYFLYLAALSSALIEKEDGCQSAIYYSSKSMTVGKSRYLCIEKLALALVALAQ